MVASLKDTIAKKDEGIEWLLSLKHSKKRYSETGGRRLLNFKHAALQRVDVNNAPWLDALNELHRTFRL
ncbi:hypothetical protein SAY87_015254 [Trapa incisa]|uniref:Uncharacterized protein n=1 Tax=Trapa incisa TaxID=236973 RepID=A0AAN7GWW4_9MYRT|nr:hypothetical protein SAY87_015254 [Trapa incisa]